MRKYETIFIANPDLSGDEVKEITEKMKGLIEKMGGQVEKAEDWGVKKLAYEVRKKPKGHYVYMKYSGDPRLVSEVERNLKINEGVIKYQSLKAEERKVVAKAAPAPPAEVPAEA